MKITIEIELDNDAFAVVDAETNESVEGLAYGQSVAEMLTKFSHRLDGRQLEVGESFSAKDYNGNTCLKAIITK